MLPGTSGQFSQHSDVLSAQPEGDAEIQGLVAELRRRGNLAFKNKSYMESDMLYTKAIEVFPQDAAIFGNRSAARLAMKNFKLALEDADAAVKLGAYPKAHFRRGQALAGLLRYRDAQHAYEECAKQDPAQEALANKEALRMKQLADEKDAAPAPKSTASAGASLEKKPAVKASPAKAKEVEAEPVEEEGEDESGLMKGYKVLDNGKKTTFFHREISAEQKAKLEQANKPQALSAAQAPAIQTNVKAGSKWNAAGTFEEKDMTKFATDRITELLKEASTLLDDYIVEVKSVSEFDGIASCTVIRGTRKTPFDFTFTVEWVAHLESGEVMGKLFCSQCTNSASDLEVEFEVRWENRSKAGAMEKKLLDHLRGEFRKELEAKLLVFAKEFAATT